MFKMIITNLAVLGTAFSAFARDIPVPTGQEVGRHASSCTLGSGEGDLGQTGKAGEYNGFCNQLTDAEICLALIKQSITSRGSQHTMNETRSEFCLDEFRKNLLGE